jgi:hypothetical protein
VRIFAAWLTCVAVAAAVALGSTTGCTETFSDCGLARDCDLCVRDPVCAWCFETGQCLEAVTHCPGDRAVTMQACEEGEH